MNTTVHLFISSTKESRSSENERNFLTTCYPAFSKDNPKGWCTIRKSGVFQNKNPEASSGWGFCSTDASQQECNGQITSNIKDSAPHKVTFLDGEYCLGQLKNNLRVEQPNEAGVDLKAKVEKSQTFCVGQVYNHSFELEKFVQKGVSYTNINNITNLKVSNTPKTKMILKLTIINTLKLTKIGKI